MKILWLYFPRHDSPFYVLPFTFGIQTHPVTRYYTPAFAPAVSLAWTHSHAFLFSAYIWLFYQDLDSHATSTAEKKKKDLDWAHLAQETGNCNWTSSLGLCADSLGSYILAWAFSMLWSYFLFLYLCYLMTSKLLEDRNLVPNTQVSLKNAYVVKLACLIMLLNK